MLLECKLADHPRYQCRVRLARELFCLCLASEFYNDLQNIVHSLEIALQRMENYTDQNPSSKICFFIQTSRV